MMAWENLEELINENESDSEDQNSSNNEENPPKNLMKEEEEANNAFSESSSSTDYDCLEQERIRRQHSLAWQY